MMYVMKIRERNLGSFQTGKGRRGVGLESARQELGNERGMAAIGGVSEDGLKRVNLGLITGLEEEMPYKAGPQRPRLAPEESQRSELTKPVISSEIHAETDTAHLTEEEKQATMNAENLERFKQAEASKLDSFKSEKKAEIEGLTDQIDSYNSQVETFETQLNAMNTAIESYQSTYTEQMQVNKEIENEITQKDKYLTAITNQDFQNKQHAENEALGKEIQSMETALYDHKEDLQSKLVESKKAYSDQTAQIQYLEEKIDFFEENYPTLMTNLKAAHEKRSLLSTLYSSLPKDLKREH